MALILNIDTTHETGSIALGKNGICIDALTHNEMKDHAGWIQPAIQILLSRSNISFNELDAVSVTAGPGSYTGIRVGMATAKGLCYTLNKPLILINTLQLMAAAVLQRTELAAESAEMLLAPMIDARREEVWTGVFDQKGNEIIRCGVKKLDENSFNETLTMASVLFFGSGSDKWKRLCADPRARFISGFVYTATDMCGLSENYYQKAYFADLLYSEPYYLKEFFTYKKNS